MNVEGNMRLLIIENSESDANGSGSSRLEEALAGWGHQVVWSKGDSETERLLEEGVFEVLIADGASLGLLSSKQLQPESGESDPQLPYVIALGTPADLEALAASLAAGAHDCLLKPIDLNALWLRLEVARRALARRRALAGRLDELKNGGSPPPFDLPDALERFGGDEGLLEEFLQAFLDELPGHLDELRASLDGKDWANGVRVAHGLKGSAAHLSAGEIRRAAAALEELLCHADEEPAGQALRRLTQAAQSAQAFAAEGQAGRRPPR